MGVKRNLLESQVTGFVGLYGEREFFGGDGYTAAGERKEHQAKEEEIFHEGTPSRSK